MLRMDAQPPKTTLIHRGKRIEVERWGGKAICLEEEWGKPLDMQKVRDAFRKSKARIARTMNNARVGNITDKCALTVAGFIEHLGQLRAYRSRRDGRRCRTCLHCTVASSHISSRPRASTSMVRPAMPP